MVEISRAVVRLHKEHTGRGPTGVRAHIDGDAIVCLLEGGYTQLERALLAQGEKDMVVEWRRLLNRALQDELVQAVEAIIGRRVRSFMSAADPAAELQAHTFVLESRASDWVKYRSTFRSTFASSRHLALVADDARRYVDANAAACDALGVQHRDLIGRRVEDFTPDGLRERVADMWQEFLREGEQSGEYPLQTAAGDLRVFQYRAQANWARGFHLSVLVPPERF